MSSAGIVRPDANDNIIPKSSSARRLLIESFLLILGLVLAMALAVLFSTVRDHSAQLKSLESKVAQTTAAPTFITPSPRAPAIKPMQKAVDVSGVHADFPICYDCNIYASSMMYNGKISSETSQFASQVDDANGHQYKYTSGTKFVIGTSPIIRTSPTGVTSYSWLVNPSVKVKYTTFETGTDDNRVIDFAETRLPNTAEKTKGAGLVIECRLPRGTKFLSLSLAGVVETLPIPKNQNQDMGN